MTTRNPADRARKLRMAGALTGLAVVLGACQHTGDQVATASVPDDYRLRHPIAVQEANQSVVILVGHGRGGLSAEQQACVFRPFYRAPEARSGGQSGLGLGLAVADRIATVFGGTIRVDMHRAGTSVIATVADDGPGIEPHVLDRIFDPFFTTRRDSGGTGLGLPVSLGISEMHGGSLTVTSPPGHGATFTLRLPIVGPV